MSADRSKQIGRCVHHAVRPQGQKGFDPNDRQFNEDVEQRVKQMNPLEFDRLMREDEE
jgi:hypothetical protein